MAVRKNLKRIMISLPKAQVEWLNNFCKKQNIRVSKYISWILAKKAEEMLEILRVSNWRDLIDTAEDYEELQRIIHARWIED